ncbi:MAG: ATP-binding cassette domain-containing protein [Deltaproteobacteria bacterium]|nr:ATP-binding cassette domain-containing protein [Deltaproteobacteria bacterium]
MIEVREVFFSYPSRGGPPRAVFTGLNLTVPQGAYVALMGPNGSGKSTLGKLIKGLLTPGAGEVWIGGRPLKPGEISSQVGYIFANPENQILSSVVEEDVAFELENIGLDPAEMERRVGESLRWVEMEAYRRHSPHRLSGGQQQKVVLAGALARGSEVLVLDEPTSMLDLRARKEILDLLEKLQREGRRTVLHITHSWEEAMRASQFVYLDRGRILFFGPWENFLSGPWLSESLSLDLPSFLKIVRGLRRLGHPVPTGIRSEEDLKRFLLSPENQPSLPQSSDPVAARWIPSEPKP